MFLLANHFSKTVAPMSWDDEMYLFGGSFGAIDKLI